MIRLFIVISALVYAQSVGADMGSIPFKSGVVISEPKQDAIIAWNGIEQLLYLQTTLSASEETKVLEVMPLPSKPTVEATSEEVFKRCASLLPKIRKKREKSGMDPFGAPPAEAPAAQVVERKKIGAHDLRVVELLNPKRFEDWIGAEFKGEGLEVPRALLDVIGEYTDDGFTWFIFDVIDLKAELGKKTPLKIRFKTTSLFYPMRITRTEKGFSTVSLSVLTNILFEVEDCVGIPRSEIVVPARPREITGTRLHWVDPDIYELLRRPATARIRTWEISGSIDEFEKDLLIRNPKLHKKEGEQDAALKSQGVE